MIENDLWVDINNILKNDVDRNSLFQLNFFVLGKEPTHQAKLKRCVDEIKLRKRGIESMIAEMEEVKDKNNLLYLEMEGKFNSAKEAEIKCRMIDRRIESNNKIIDDTNKKIESQKEEMLFFVSAFKSLEKIEPMKPWDDLEVQTEYWNAHLNNEINYRLLMHLPIDIEVMKMSLALPNDNDVKKKVIALIGNMQKINKTLNENKENNGN